MRRNRGVWSVLHLLLLVFLFFLVCPVRAATHELLTGDVKITLTTSSERILPSEDVIVTLTVEAPSYLKVVIPDLRTRFSGFSLAEDFAKPLEELNGRTHQNYQWHLVPEPAAPKYRLAPFAVETFDQRVSPPRRGTFATKAILFPGEGARPSVTGDPEVTLKPEWIPRPRKA